MLKISLLEILSRRRPGEDVQRILETCPPGDEESPKEYQHRISELSDEMTTSLATWIARQQEAPEDRVRRGTAFGPIRKTGG